MSKESVFAKTIQEHQGLLFKVTSIYTDNQLDQEDLFQEVVYQLWKYFDTFRNESKITTWMYRVAMNTSISFIKKAKRKPRSISITEVVLNLIEERDTVMEERLKILYQHIGKLNALEKGLILLLLEDKSYQEIAVITGLTESNVGTRISRIKKKLKENMTKK